MSHLPRFERALLAFWLALWLPCFVLAVKAAIDGFAVPDLHVIGAEDPDGFPTLAGGLRPSADLGPLRPGDRLLRLNDLDLRGMSTLGLYARTMAEAASDRTVEFTLNRNGEVLRAPVTFPSYRAAIWLRLPGSLVFVVAGVLLLLRAAPSRLVRTAFQLLLCMAIGNVSYFGATTPQTAASMLVHILYIGLFVPLAILAAWDFPEGRHPSRTFWPWLFIVGAPLHASLEYGVLMNPGLGTALYQMRDVVGGAVIVFVITANFVHTDPIGRRRIKWVLFGVYLASLPPIALTVLAAIDPRFQSVWDLSSIAYAALPVCIFIAIVRCNLFDIDRLISATASYNLILVAVIGAGFALMPSAAEAATELLGLAPAAGQTILSLLLAAVVVPAHRRLHARVERLFFPERAAVVQGMEDLSLDLGESTGPQDLLLRTGRGLDALLRSEACVVLARSEDGYMPVYVRGCTAPPALNLESTLIEAIGSRATPWVVDDAEGAAASGLSVFDRAVLEGVGASVVVPVFRGEQLVVLVSLGRKHSGDLYTSTDLTLLSMVARRVGLELRRFEDAVLLEEARKMQLALRRYVPGAVADQLERGEGMEQGEREVSVLFVDIRGYTTLSESRRADEIFSTVNRYTSCVSAVVVKHGGSVVEFSGDGMMAVFGAPRALADKELAAVRAGREIIESVEALSLDEPGGREHLSVGVGIATGAAFVGNIRAVDRSIWSAIGNTTNLAARLQNLTREFDAAMVIDRTTRERLPAATSGFELLEAVAIRGRSQREDVYALPLDPHSRCRRTS